MERVSYEALNRTKVFGVDYAQDWTPVPPAPPTTAQTNTLKLYGDLNGVLTQLKDAGADKEYAAGAFHAGTTSKGVLRVALLAELRGLNETAGTIAEVQRKPQIMDKFRMPHGHGDKELADKARAFASAGEAMAADFEALGHAPGFADALRQQVVVFETTKDDQADGLEKQAGGTAKIGALIADGLLILKQLERLMANLYKGNAEKLGEWHTASHVEHLSHKHKPKPPGTTPP